MTAADLLVSFSSRDTAELRRTPAEREARLKRTFRWQWFGFFVLCGGSAAVLALEAPLFAAQHPILFSVIAVVAIGKHVFALFDELGGKAHQYAQSPPELRGVLAPEEVAELAAMVGKRLGSTQKPNVYVVVDKEANAFTANSMFLGFIPRYNAIYLNSYLFRALSRDELRAILVHELAHFHRYMNPLVRNAWLGAAGSIAACVAFLSAFPAFTGPVTAILVVWWAPLPFIWLFNIIAAAGRRDLEYACDAIAAEFVGAESMVNALLKMGDRAEIYEMVEHELGQHLDENPKASVAEIARELLERVPEHPVSHDEARAALYVDPLPDHEGGNKQARKKFLELFRRNRRLRKALHVVRWSRFDTIRSDGWLDRDELHGYVYSLARRQRAATHEVATDHPDEEPVQTHPSTRKRTIYLYLHFLASDDLDAAEEHAAHRASR